ncbi:aldo/keto reductase [Kutzneria sp. CA-103260]|uniref:aldo/keto reductase n=1 Tax=Kutzneria sp. CA-103260 TaxID=2802641 RepID=UPI001BAA7ACD|nr:aldo/keto reductase [Kutzneria sp. CA-103260]QUQ67020.1 aldo/keto reductase [Kutzneria sp. CA-103260]
MHRRELGESGLKVSAIGLGCMGMSEFYGQADQSAGIRSIHRAIDRGMTLIDTAPSFGAPSFGESANELLVGRALRGRRDSVVLATKFGFAGSGDDRVVDNSPAYIRRSVDESLARLETDHIDLYYLYRRSPHVPIEEVVLTMKELVQAGKVRHLGLSEVSAETLRQANEIHPIAALQSEYSLLSRHIEDRILPTARELGVGVVAYAPVARGLLAGALTTLDGLEPNDLRRHQPRFQQGNLGQNLALVQRVRAVAEEVGCTTAQLALAWLLAKDDGIVPIPSSTSRRHVEENAAAAEIVLSARLVKELDEAIQPDEVIGDRNTAASLALMEL